MVPLELSVQEVKQRLDDDSSAFSFIDCREQVEYDAARIDGATLIPMNEIPGRVSEIDKDKPVIIHCHHGGRSYRVMEYLRSQGYQAINMAGGIDAWSLEIDSSVPRY